MRGSISGLEAGSGGKEAYLRVNECYPEIRAPAVVWTRAVCGTAQAGGGSAPAVQTELGRGKHCGGIVKGGWCRCCGSILLRARVQGRLLQGALGSGGDNGRHGFRACERGDVADDGADSRTKERRREEKEGRCGSQWRKGVGIPGYIHRRWSYTALAGWVRTTLITAVVGRAPFPLWLATGAAFTDRLAFSFLSSNSTYLRVLDCLTAFESCTFTSQALWYTSVRMIFDSIGIFAACRNCCAWRDV